MRLRAAGQVQCLLYSFTRAVTTQRRYNRRMTPKALAMLTKPRGQLVYPHTNDAHLAEAVGLFASTGLRDGEAVILIMSASHCKPIRERLEREGWNLNELERPGQSVSGGAEELIPT